MSDAWRSKPFLEMVEAEYSTKSYGIKENN